MRKILRTSLLALSAAVIMTSPALAELTLVITEGVGKRRPVAIVPFAYEGAGQESPLNVADVIAADLNRSGRFAPLEEGDMLQKPE